MLTAKHFKTRTTYLDEILLVINSTIVEDIKSFDIVYRLHKLWF